MITKIICALALSISVVVLNISAQAEETADIIDGVTYADNCLYMLESTRQLMQPDCDKLLRWHKESFPHLPDVKSIKSDQRAWFERNLKMYLSTLHSVKKIMASEVTRH